MTDHDAPLILALHAATPPSCVVVVRGDRVLARRTGPFGRRTDAWITGAVGAAAEEAGVELGELAAIAATAGPGTFTGIRVALATALGVARGLDVPATGVGTLEAFVAWGRAELAPGRPLLALVDARRDQFYAALSRSGSDLDWGPELLSAPELQERLAHLADVEILGTAAEAAGLPAPGSGGCPATGAALATATRLADDAGAALPPAHPVYLRPPDARPGTNPLRRRRTRGERPPSGV